jgi:hypothetical protein
VRYLLDTLVLAPVVSRVQRVELGSELEGVSFEILRDVDLEIGKKGGAMDWLEW